MHILVKRSYKKELLPYKHNMTVTLFAIDLEVNNCTNYFSLTATTNIRELWKGLTLVLVTLVTLVRSAVGQFVDSVKVQTIIWLARPELR